MPGDYFGKPISADEAARLLGYANYAEQEEVKNRLTVLNGILYAKLTMEKRKGIDSDLYGPMHKAHVFWTEAHKKTGFIREVPIVDFGFESVSFSYAKHSPNFSLSIIFEATGVNYKLVLDGRTVACDDAAEYPDAAVEVLRKLNRYARSVYSKR